MSLYEGMSWVQIKHITGIPHLALLIGSRKTGRYRGFTQQNYSETVLSEA
jgi:hypothetical protein